MISLRCVLSSLCTHNSQITIFLMCNYKTGQNGHEKMVFFRLNGLKFHNRVMTFDSFYLYWFKEIVFPFCFWYFQIVCRIAALWFKYFVCHHRADSSPAGALWCDVVLTHQHLNVNLRFCFVFFKQSDSMHAIIHSWNVRNIFTKYSQKCVICHKLCRNMSLAALR